MISDNFLDYLKKVENGGKAGWDEDAGLWYPHASPEGGNDTIGYGHKLLDNEVEVANIGLEDSVILEMLFTDIDRANDVANRIVEGHFGYDYNKLDADNKCMLVDFAYNLGGGGLRKFPKFVKAVCENDLNTMREEYKRYYSANGTKKELKQRNEQFYMLFLS